MNNLFKKNKCHILLCIVTLLLIHEVLLRLILADEMDLSYLIQYDPKAFPAFSPRPNARAIYSGTKLRYPAIIQSNNEFGYRGTAYPLKNTDEAMRIAILGDSYVYGLGVKDWEISTEFLQSSLLKDSDRKIEVLNFGVSTLNLDEIYGLYTKEHTLWDHNFAVLVLDSQILHRSIGEIFGGPMFGRIGTWLRSNTYTVRLAQKGVISRLETWGVYRSRIITSSAKLLERVEKFEKAVTAEGRRFAVVVLGSPLSNLSSAELSHMLEDSGIPTLNASSILNNPRNILIDDGHLSAIGNRTLAEKMRGWLKDLIYPN